MMVTWCDKIREIVKRWTDKIEVHDSIPSLKANDLSSQEYKNIVGDGLSSGGSKAWRSVCHCIKRVNLKDSEGRYAFEDQLSNAVSCVDLEVCVSMVEKKNFDKASVVLIDDTCANIDYIFSSERGVRSNATVGT